MRRPLVATAAFLLLAVAAAHPPLPSAGFSHDDWPFLESFTRAGLGDAVRMSLRDNPTRPLQAAQTPLLYRAAARRPEFAQFVLFLLQGVEALLLFLLARRLTGREDAAMAVAAFAALYPGRPIVSVWVSNAPQLAAHSLALGALLLHERWRERRSLAVLCAGQALFAAAALSYEAVLFTPLLLAAAPGARGRDRRGLLAALAPFAVTAGVVLLWQRWGVMHWLGAANPKVLRLDWGHLRATVILGFDNVTYGVPRSVWRQFLPAVRVVPVAQWLLIGVLAAASARLLGRGERGGAGALLRLSVAAAVAGYLPFALSGSYLPTMTSAGSRINGIAAWSFGFWAASALAAAGTFAWRPAFVAALAASLAWTGASVHQDYARSWSLQRSILDDAAEKTSALTGPATILYTGPTRAGQAIVFAAPYDFSSALRVRTGRADLSGGVVTYRMSFAADAAEERPDGRLTERYPYADALYLYHAGRRDLRRLSGPPPADWLYGKEE